MTVGKLGSMLANIRQKRPRYPLPLQNGVPNFREKITIQEQIIHRFLHPIITRSWMKKYAPNQIIFSWKSFIQLPLRKQRHFEIHHFISNDVRERRLSLLIIIHQQIVNSFYRVTLYNIQFPKPNICTRNLQNNVIQQRTTLCNQFLLPSKKPLPPPFFTLNPSF